MHIQSRSKYLGQITNLHSFEILITCHALPFQCCIYDMWQLAILETIFVKILGTSKKDPRQMFKSQYLRKHHETAEIFACVPLCLARIVVKPCVTTKKGNRELTVNENSNTLQNF